MTIPDPYICLPMMVDDYEYDNAETEVVSDWDMSDAGTSAWTAINSATLSKQSNGEGGQCLRIAYNGTTAPAARQIVLNQDRNKIRARLRSDGNCVARLVVNNVELYRTTLSTDWVEVELNHYTLGTAIQIEAFTSTAGEYVEADIVSAKTFASRTLDTCGTNHAYIAASQTATSKAEPIPDKGFNNFSFARNLRITTPTLTGISNHTVSVLARNTATAATEYLSDIWDGTNVFNIMLKLSTGGYRFYVGGASGLQAANGSYPLDNSIVHVVGRYDGSNTKITVDTINGTNAPTPTAPVVGTQNLTIGTSYADGNAWGDSIYDYRFWNSALTDAQIEELYFWLQREYSRLYI